MEKISTEEQLPFFLDLAKARARLTPDRTAIIDYSWGNRREYTYLQLERTSNDVAKTLSELGTKRGDIVSVLSYNNVEFVYLYLSTAKLGHVLAPLNWRLSPTEIAFMIDDLRPKIIYYHEELKNILDKSLKISKYEPKIVEDIKSLQKTRHYTENIQNPKLSLEDIQMLLYTGGTTGRPKAAKISYRQALYNAINTVISWGLTPDDVSPLFFPFFHTGGWHVITVPLLLIGGRLIITKRFEPNEAIDIIEREKCTVVIAVPTMFYTMTKSKKFENTRFESVRFFKSGGGMSPLNLMKIFWDKGKRYFQGYGLTEAGPNLFYTPPEDMKSKPLSIGKPSMFAEVKIVKENGKEAVPGEVGELWVRGPIVFSGYWNRPEETKDTLVNGWVRTGDLFTRDSDGHYYFTERKKFMIKTGGENVYPTEVEEAIRAHPDIDEVAVFGVPDPKWGEAVAAVIKPKPRRAITFKELKDFLKPKLARYKIPKYLWIVDEIPKTSVGKIDYVELKRKYSKLVTQG